MRAAPAAEPAGADDFPEVACLLGRLPPGVLAAAAKRAAELGIGAERVLIANGHISEEGYLHALGARLGIAFEPLDGVSRADCPVDEERLLDSAANGMLPIGQPGETVSLVVAPRGAATRRLTQLIEANPSLASRFRFSSDERIIRFALRCAGATLAERAASGLKQRQPAFSAAPRGAGAVAPLAILALLSAFAVLAILAPPPVPLALGITISTLFLAWLGLRVLGACVRPKPEPADLPAAGSLPVYTVIAALYREAASVTPLLAAIERLDYPGIMAQTPQEPPAR